MLDSGSLAVIRANTGIDVQTWVGSDTAMYPVHELVLTPQLAARIWELTEKQINQLHISDNGLGNDFSLISAGDLEALPMLAEAEEGEPNMERVCEINGWILLKEKATGDGYLIRTAALGPVEGGRIQFFKDEGCVIACYSDGKLEAAFYGYSWDAMENVQNIFETVSNMWQREN